MPLPNNTKAYPPFTSKAAMMQAIRDECANSPNLYDLICRISNTDTDDFADPTARHADMAGTVDPE